MGLRPHFTLKKVRRKGQRALSLGDGKEVGNSISFTLDPSN